MDSPNRSVMLWKSIFPTSDVMSRELEKDKKIAAT